MNVLLKLKDNLSGEDIKRQEKYIAQNLERYAKIENFYTLPLEIICNIVESAGKLSAKVARQLLFEANKKFGKESAKILMHMDVSDFSIQEIHGILSVLDSVPIMQRLKDVMPPDDIDWDYSVPWSEEDKVEEMVASVQKPPNYEENIFVASKHGNIQSVLYTIAVNPTLLNAKKEKNDYTPLNVSAYFGQTSLLKVLLFHGALTEIPDKDGRTPLVNAVRKGNAECVSFLLEQGAETNVCDKKGNYPLHYAAANAYNSILEDLLKHGADPNVITKTKDTPLMIASAAGNDAACRLLIDFHADVNAKNENGLTAYTIGKDVSTRNLIKNAANK